MSEPPPLSDNLAVVIADVESAGMRIGEGDISPARTLPHDIDVLTRAIDGGTVQGETLVTLKYARGRARHLLNYIAQLMGLPVDREMAEKAVADYQSVADAIGDDATQTEYKANALFWIAQVKVTQLDDEAGGYRYFQQCADMKQGGCMNVIAAAKIVGVEGIPRNMQAGAELYRDTYETGLDYGCAGAFSAHALARLAQFTDVRVEGRTGLDWIRRAYRLADQMKARSEGADLCATGAMQVTEYLMRLQAGERQDGLIKDIEEKNGPLPAATRSTVDYLLGRTDGAAYRRDIGNFKNVSLRCDMAFLGAWKSSISRQSSEFNGFRKIIDAADPEDCSEYQLFVKGLKG